MPGLAAYLAAGGLLVLAMDFVAPPVGIGLPVATWPALDNATTQTVDRSHKSDRLRLPTTTVDRREPTARPAPGMPIGCEPVFSPLSAAAQLNFPGRCIATIVPVAARPA